MVDRDSIRLCDVIVDMKGGYMKIDGEYRIGWYVVKLKAGPLEVVDGKASIMLTGEMRKIKWRWLVWRLGYMFCDTLDIRLPAPKMRGLHETNR